MIQATTEVICIGDQGYSISAGSVVENTTQKFNNIDIG